MHDKYTNEAFEIMQNVRKNGTLIATNIIIDYVYGDKKYQNYDKEKLEESIITESDKDLLTIDDFIESNFNS